MSEQQKEPKSFFEKSVYKIGFPIFVFFLIGLLYLYSAQNPITDAKTVLKAFPASPPSYSSGKDIYGFFCIKCHGKNGAPVEGLTFTSNAGEKIEPAELDDPEFIRGHSPQSFFGVVSNGKGDVMPGFKTRASEEKRWDVAMYTYLMHFDPKDISTGTGKILYESNCAKCHGAGGKGGGQGAKTDDPAPDLTDQEMMVKRTDNDLLKSVKNDVAGNHAEALTDNSSASDSESNKTLGSSDAGKDKPEDTDVESMMISDEDLFKIIGYIRTFAFSDADKIGE